MGCLLRLFFYIVCNKSDNRSQNLTNREKTKQKNTFKVCACTLLRKKPYNMHLVLGFPASFLLFQINITSSSDQVQNKTSFIVKFSSLL